MEAILIGQDADGSTEETKSSRRPIVLTTLEEVEQLVDADIEDYGDYSPQTYKLDPRFVMEKVIDPEDRKFLQSEIVSITSVGALSQEDEIIEDKNEAESAIGRETTASPTVKKKVETCQNLSTGITAGRKGINPSEHIVLDIENKSDSKDVFENVIDNECVTEVSVSTNRTPTAKYVSSTEKTNLKNKTPKQKFNEKFKSPKFGTKEEIPAVEVDKTEEREILKTSEEKNKSHVNLSSGSKRGKSFTFPETPKTDMQNLLPSLCKSTPGKRKHIESQMEGGNSTGSSDDIVPSSHKKVRTKSNILGSNMEESEEIVHTVPDISVHLKPRTKTPKTDVKAKLLQQQMNDQDNSPRLTRNYVAAKQSIHSVGTDLNVDITPRCKGLSSDLKGAPEPLKNDVDNTLELEEEESDLDTVNKPQKEVLGPRQMRKSVGSHTMIKTPKGDREPEEKLIKTPVSLRKRQNLGSASKKAVKKVQELHETRKRILPTDVSDTSDADSEVTFPKLKTAATSDKRVPKRLSTPATQTQKEDSKGTPNRRYSLRNR